MNLASKIAAQLGLEHKSVAAVVALLAEKNTVPFIARYRKEATNGLDEVQIRAIEERRTYLSDLDARRGTILAAIAEQGKLTDELRALITNCTNKAELEDLYLPYKKKRRTRAGMARERGLEPLAQRILAQSRQGDPLAEAEAFVDADKGVPDKEAALAGARDIVAEAMADRPDLRAAVRHTFFTQGMLASAPVNKKSKERTKFEQYYDFQESVKTIPSHRFLAICRGEHEKVLRAHIEVDVDKLIARLEHAMQVSASSPFAAALREAIRDGYRRLLAPSAETDVRTELKRRSDRDAINVFADNLRNLLLASPLGPKTVVGIDPGLRTGCKCVAVSNTGKFLDNITIFLARSDTSAARRDFLAFAKKHRPVAIAVGNGTGGRETEAFVRGLLTDTKGAAQFVVQVSEAGASVYSASDVAREEFADLDLTVRGAISIARRLQDPLAELVKIEPKAIGVGQYQHDVHQGLLQGKLAEVVESCVNHVGVDLNTASAPLLSFVAGLGPSLAKKIVAHRDKHGAFRSRRQLLKTPGMGPRAFEQAAGFLRIRDSENPLDASAVHPERYPLVERIAKDLGVKLSEMIGNSNAVSHIDITRYLSDGVGEPTLRDIVAELEKPGRDPRSQFEPPKFRADVNTLDDLEVGMSLAGVVTNVTAFGAFVDVGVHQDGLVHVSQLADRFVKNPSEVVKVGDKLSVRVLEVDIARKRIALSARSDASPAPRPPNGPAKGNARKDRPLGGEQKTATQNKFANNPFAALKKGK